MTVVLGWWLLPAAITLIWLMFAVIESSGPSGGFLDMTGLLSIIGLVPVLAAWLIYFMIF